MLSLLNKAFEPSISYPDKITYMTSVKYLQSIHSDNTQTVVEKLTDLLTSKNTRLQGLQFLEIALQQNSDIYLKGRWSIVLYEIIKEPVSSIVKEHACKIFCMLIPYMAKDAGANEMELQKFASYLFPYLLSQVENNVEWVESAGMCLCACLKCFPQLLEPHREQLLNVLFKQISHSVSPKTFEVFAECFCYLPSCLRQDNPNIYGENWANQYLTTLNTMHYLLNTFLTFLSDDPYSNTSVPDIGVFPFVHEDDDDVYPVYMKGVRRFLNLSRCLAKMLSNRSTFAVQVPIKLTLECISRLFQVQDVAKIVSTSVEMQIILSTLTQMQIAALVVLEALILNFNLVPYSFLISEMMVYALQSSKLSNMTREPISPLRQSVWTLLNQWISLHGAKVSHDLVGEPSTIFEELLTDISIESSASKQTSILDKCQALSSKSKKNMALNSDQKTFVNKSQQAVCKKALKTLENLLYSGANFISKKSLQEIFTKVVQVAYAITPQEEYPFPYDDHMCRKLLYSVLLAIAVVTKIDQREPIQFAVGIFKKAFSDPSTKVVRLCHKAMAMCRLYLHPKKPMLIAKDYNPKTRRNSNASRMAEVRYNEWSTDEYVQNLPPVESVSNVSENASPRIVQTYQNPNEDETTPEEYMQQDAHYSEQASENQCNGEDILEMQNSSQCRDEDSEDDDDDEEDEEQSYGEEEMNQDVEMQDHLYIPSTSKHQVLNSVPVASDADQNVEAQDYEELRPCGKSEDKNINLNGMGKNVMIEEEISSPSIQNVASENGVYDGFDEEDLEEEEGDEDDEEEGAMYPAEKRIPEYLEAPASKKQKMEEVKEEPPKERERSRTPTLEEMKADFVCEIDDVKS